MPEASKFYAQAKSSKDPQDTKNAIAVLKKALTTLDEDASQSDCKRLIYITNLDNPFAEPDCLRYFSGPLSYSGFSALPKACQKKIRKICREKKFFRIDFDRFYVLAFPFVGDDDNKYRIVKQEVQNLLNDLSIADRVSSGSILSRWQLVFHQNATKIDTALTIRKADMIWPLISWLCELDVDSEELEVCDETQKELIVNGYQSVINDKVEKFEFVSRVMSDYNQFKDSNITGLRGRQVVDKFAESYSEKYGSEFVVDNQDEVSCREIARIALRRVVNVRLRINRIKEGTGLS